MRYKRKPQEPEEVEAIQWNGHNHPEITKGVVYGPYGLENRYAINFEPQFDIQRGISIGDYIIKHACGTFSVCKPSEFEAGWEKCDE